jgi:D-ribose pyranose/furanose isomerase RbsD
MPVRTNYSWFKTEVQLLIPQSIDISVIADELTMSSTPTTMSDLDQKFRALDNRIGLILNVHEQLKEDISQEQAMLRDEVNHWFSKTSLQFNELSSLPAAISSPPATINDKKVLEAFNAINRHLENLERSGTIAQKTCCVLKKTMEQKLRKLEAVEVFLARAQEIEEMQEGRHEELKALASKTGQLTVVDAIHIAGTVVGLFSFFTNKSIMLRAAQKAGGRDLTPTMFPFTRGPANGNGHEILARDVGASRLASYPFELAQSRYFWEDQELNSKQAKTPFQVRRMLHYLVDHTSAWGPKRGFLPVAQLHPDVLQADVHLHLCQLVSIIRRDDRVSSLSSSI